MRATKTLSMCLGLAATLLIGGNASAQEMQDPEPERSTEYETPDLLSPYGMSAMIGGGVFGFTDSDATDFTNVGGAWEARFAFGTREMIGTEVAYTGTAQGLDAVGLDDDALLISTGLEALGRINVGVYDWQPYAIAGVGWRRYDVTNSDFNTSNIREDDNVFEIPLGIGVSYRMNQFVLDVRGVFRPTLDNDLIVNPADEDEAQLHNWSATARLGFEF